MSDPLIQAGVGLVTGAGSGKFDSCLATDRGQDQDS